MANTLLPQAVSNQGRGVAPILLTIALSGCAVAPAVQYSTTAVDLGVLTTTGKSIGDHALSYTIDRDCKSYRIIKGEQVCQMTPVQQMEDVFNKRRP
jgi:hypothetical protein